LSRNAIKTEENILYLGSYF